MVWLPAKQRQMWPTCAQQIRTLRMLPQLPDALHAPTPCRAYPLHVLCEAISHRRRAVRGPRARAPIYRA